MKEIWKPVRGKEEYAEISNMGQIHRFEREYYCGRNHQAKRIQEEDWTYGNETSDGYFMATIGGVVKGVHVWVYITFVGDIPEGLEVNHIDEDKHNNCVWNLNLMTRKENIRWGTGNARRAASNRGKKQSSETIEKRVAKLRGKPNPKLADALKGRKQSDETKKKIGDANRGRKRPDVAEAQRGKKRPTEVGAKISAAKRGKYNTKKSKAVQALNPKTLEVVMEFASTMEAERQYGFSQGNISQCCNGKRKSHKGYIWRYKE